MKKFDDWNIEKKKTHKETIYRGFKEREIFYAKLGYNIGFEQNGIGDNFIRPIVILKKFNSSLFYAIPLSTTEKRNQYYFEFEFKKGFKSVAILSQVRNLDAKRLLNKIGMMEKDDFELLKEKIRNFFD
ncbi:MAG: type II toxin-antitoxin system PemK/MazF family toxin [Sulfurovum sp.]